MTEVRTPEINDNTRIPYTVENYRHVSSWLIGQCADFWFV